MTDDKLGRRTAIWGVLRPLAALSLLIALPALAACTTAEGTNAFATPATFEREVMTSTLQGLDLVPQDEKQPNDQRRAPLVLPKDTGQLPPPSRGAQTAALPTDSDNPTINTAGLTQADIDHLRNARVVDLNSIAGRPMTDIERRQMAARLQAANQQAGQNGQRSLLLPPVSYFSDYKGKDAVCLAKDGTLVSLSDAKCPQEIKNALRREAPMSNGVDAQIGQDIYNAKNGIAGPQ